MMDKIEVMKVNIDRNKNENAREVLVIWKNLKFCDNNTLYRYIQKLFESLENIEIINIDNFGILDNWDNLINISIINNIATANNIVLIDLFGLLVIWSISMIFQGHFWYDENVVSEIGFEATFPV